MALERKPAEASESKPEYPNSDEYSADRRGFLALIGVVAAGSVGYFAYKALSTPAVATPGTPPPNLQNGPVSMGNQPQVTVPGAVPANVQPQAQVPGEASVQVKQPDPAEPKVQAPGKVAVDANNQPEAKTNETPPVVEPKAAVPGGIGPPPEQRPQPVEPKTNIKGGSGMIVKHPNRKQA